MRKIEEKMLNAISIKATRWQSGNTVVEYNRITDRSCVYLHGNHIATVHHDTGCITVNSETLYNYPTRTTCSRLRALGADVRVRQGVPILNEEATTLL